MINTLNETHLHKALKALYCAQSGGTEEAACGPYIADIAAPGGEIIEIQTGTLGRLLKKTEFFIGQGRKVKVVYPVAAVKYIETFSKATGKTSRRKSPAKKGVRSVFRELSSLAPVLLSAQFTLEILEVEVTEERTAGTEPVQSRNRRRRFKKAWIKTGKRLEQIGNTVVLHGRKSYEALLPKDLPQQFTSKEFFTLLKAEDSRIKPADSSIMIWLYARLGILAVSGKKGRFRLYSVTKM